MININVHYKIKTSTVIGMFLELHVLVPSYYNFIFIVFYK